MNPPTSPELLYHGRAWVFGDEVNTDDMYPGFAMKLPVAEAAQHMFDATRPDWPARVRPGDIVVGGRNFGLGSSRPVAALFRELGVSCLLAEEFNSLFLRNCLNLGLPALDAPGVLAAVREGDEIEFDLTHSTLINRTNGTTLHAAPLPGFILNIVAGGGLVAQLERDGFLTPRPQKT